MTIVGFERRKDGQSQLLVFDPSLRDSQTFMSSHGKTIRGSKAKVEALLEPYRRGNRYLRRYDEFELL